MDAALTDAEARVLGALIEKELSTPDYYPMTLNALVNACNQRSNRNPVMTLDEADVSEALKRMQRERIVWQVRTQGSRTVKYEHNMKEAAGLSRRELALLCELLLRGPQTAGELRTRTVRMTEFAAVPAVEHTLKKLAEHEKGPFVKQLPRQPGQKESRYMHLLSGSDLAEPQAPAEPETTKRFREAARIESLEARVAELEAELEELRQELRDFKQEFD